MNTAVAPPESFLTGQILIAMPAMADPRFANSVIFLCAHTPDGAMGIVVNRPLDRPDFPSLLRQLDIDTAPVRSIPLCTGGPVENHRGFVLHTPDWSGDGSLDVDGKHSLTASLDILKAIAEGSGPRKCLLALGYAGWGPGQLDQEILQNAWLNAPADDNILFDTKNHTKWQRALAQLRIDPAILSPQSGHA